VQAGISHLASFTGSISKEASFLILTLVLILRAFADKLAECALGYAVVRSNRGETAIAGFGMNGRGAVEMVVASVVLRVSHDLTVEGVITEPLLTDHQFSALIVMAFMTTLISPVALKPPFRAFREEA